MRRAFTSSVVVVSLLLIAIGCGSSGGDVTRPETQRQFGVRMARMNLWREAAFRFRRAVEIDPNDAMAHNNLAVALEANGDFEGAAREYREALRLNRSDQHIQRNYSRFVEFTQKAKKRDSGAASATDTSATTTTAAGAAAAPPATDTTTTNPPDGGSR